MENLEIYERVRQVPTSAQREIQAGRLKGKTDINPMWRIKALTEQFGPCGIGWKYTITDKRLENGANNEVSAFVDIDLYIKVDGEWSDAIKYTPRPERQKLNEAAGKPVCKDCGKPIYPVTHGGKKYSVADVAENAKKTYGEPLCWACMTARRKANESPTA